MLTFSKNGENFHRNFTMEGYVKTVNRDKNKVVS